MILIGRVPYTLTVICSITEPANERARGVVPDFTGSS
jgi:hypothetical protein